MRSSALAMLGSAAVALSGCGEEEPIVQAQPAKECVEEWNADAPAVLRDRLDDIVTRDRYRRVRVVGSIEGTRLASFGRCFVAQARSRIPRNHVFVQDENGRWRLETPTRPTVDPAPQVLEELVSRASRSPNAFVRQDGTVLLVRRDKRAPR
jgi:hypothetical protein